MDSCCSGRGLVMPVSQGPLWHLHSFVWWIDFPQIAYSICNNIKKTDIIKPFTMVNRFSVDQQVNWSTDHFSMFVLHCVFKGLEWSHEDDMFIAVISAHDGQSRRDLNVNTRMNKSLCCTLFALAVLVHLTTNLYTFPFPDGRPSILPLKMSYIQ